MSQFIERLAKAILKKVPLGYGMTKPEAVEYARAVLTELREAVTVEMLEAMNAAPASDSDDLVSAENAFQAAIDEALKEKGK